MQKTARTRAKTKDRKRTLPYERAKKVKDSRGKEVKNIVPDVAALDPAKRGERALNDAIQK
jgi:hypothetical protein